MSHPVFPGQSWWYLTWVHQQFCTECVTSTMVFSLSSSLLWSTPSKWVESTLAFPHATSSWWNLCHGQGCSLQRVPGEPEAGCVYLRSDTNHHPQSVYTLPLKSQYAACAIGADQRLTWGELSTSMEKKKCGLLPDFRKKSISDELKI